MRKPKGSQMDERALNPEPQWKQSPTRSSHWDPTLSNPGAAGRGEGSRGVGRAVKSCFYFLVGDGTWSVMKLPVQEQQEQAALFMKLLEPNALTGI